MALSGIAASTTGKVAGSIIFKIFERIKNDIGKGLDDIKVLKNVQSLYENYTKLKYVKTLWQIDKAVDLFDFYCDSYILENDVRKKIKKIQDLDPNENILIEGIAGQGKSIFLKYLFVNEIENSDRYFPIYFELRKFEEKVDLKKSIISFLSSVGFSVDDDIILYLFKNFKIIIMMDGYDELKQDLRTSLISQIEDFSTKYDNVKFIVTSRPGCDLVSSPFFRVTKLDYVKNNEHVSIIKKLCDDTGVSDSLIKKINKLPHLKEILCTPIIITLLVITYKASQQIPENLSGFYDSLFDLMLLRHDGSKPGFTRNKKCTINNFEYRQLFESISFLSKESKNYSYDSKQLYDWSTRAIKTNNIKECPEKALDDIINITCLLVKDGEDHRFIHKSVQEYYSASYIKNRPESLGKKFYEKILNDFENNFVKWRQELKFLEEIDTYRFYKFFLLPFLIKHTDIDKKSIIKNKPNFTENFAIKSIGNLSLILNQGNDQMNLVGLQHKGISGSYFLELFDNIVVPKLLRIDIKQISDAMISDISIGKPIEFPFKNGKNQKHREVSLHELITRNICKEIFMDIALSLHDKLFNRCIEITKFVAQQESTEFFDEI
jgi:hypothetical protein